MIRRVFLLWVLWCGSVVAIPPADWIEVTDQPNVVGEPMTRAVRVAPTTIHMVVTCDYFATTKLHEFGFWIDTYYSSGMVSRETNAMGCQEGGHRWSGTYNLNAMGFSPYGVSHYVVTPWIKRTVVAPGQGALVYIGQELIVCPAE